MDLSGERLIGAPKEKVWAALHDLKIMKACLPGCESIEKISDTELKAAAAVKFGPIAARFTGTMLLSDFDPPNGYTISGQGQGGVAGSAKGNAKLALADATGATKLTYHIDAQIEGKIAELGEAVTTSTTNEYAEMFLTKFTAIFAPPATDAPVYHLAQEDHDHDPTNPHVFGLPIGVIIAGFVAAASVGITLAKFFL